MNIKGLLKQNRYIRSLGKRLNIIRAFFHDEKDFAAQYMETASNRGDYRYSILLLVHSLEKGMCMPNPRPFGFDKVTQLISELNSLKDKNSFEYNLGISVLSAWKSFFDEKEWDKKSVYHDVEAFLLDKEPKLIAGSKIYKPFLIDGDNSFENIISSRHSVRNFAERVIEKADLKMPIRCFIETPTACNRQMCRLISVKDQKTKKVLDDIILGIHGFNKSTVQYFIVTYELAAFSYSGERQQGLFNAGLCTMNFVNALHANGIGSCCLQWSNKYTDDLEVRKMLGLADSERIGVVIGAGYYLPENVVPCSVRRSANDVFREI